MEAVGSALKRNTILVQNEALRHGFTQIPNHVLRDARLSFGARLSYATLLAYAWQEGSCFPGQERMARDLGVSRQSVNEFLSELRRAGYISWQRRGLGHTNLYTILDVVPDVNQALHLDVKQRRHLDVKQALQEKDSGERDPEEEDTALSNAPYKRSDRYRTGQQERQHDDERLRHAAQASRAGALPGG